MALIPALIATGGDDFIQRDGADYTSAGTVVHGYTLIGAAPLIVYLRDGGASGAVIAVASTTAEDGGGAKTCVWPAGIKFPRGCWANVVTGTVNALSSVLIEA